ncbi:Beta-barrel assembly machine subunit BamB [Ferrimonas sediminum]|uniref:Outer membrane protein assembly factor BamB n=1 Tax=Ferrimonas sediminum TaxID=718193 RepID=A0A1G8LYZ4_9GAMM|nr:outer membrane protein assembly factor BamB [Ferrimonas sediminum]SDI60962.1 Beta-barrel assembly machine subunit BamB [Ferrimonas sediminum]
MAKAGKGWLAGLMVLALMGCASSDEDEIGVKVSPLPEIEPTVTAEVVWRASSGDGIDEYWSSLSPEVAYGKVFAAERFGLITAYDQQTGKEIWRQNLRREFALGALKKNNGARLSAGISHGFNRIFIGSENGVLFALNQETGEVDWQASTRGELLSDPAIVDGKVVVNTGSGKVQAFDVDSGELLWTYELTMPSLVLRGTSGVASSQGAALTGTPDGKLVAVFSQQGAPIWEARLAEASGSNELERVVDVDSKPLVLGGTVYGTAFNGNLAAVELRSGQIKWQRQYSSYSPMDLQGNALFLTDSSGTVYSVNRQNGLETWANSSLTGRMVTGPAVAGEYLVVGDFEGYLHIMDRASGTLVGRLQIDGSGLYTQPLVVDDKIYLQTRDGRIAVVTIG